MADRPSIEQEKAAFAAMHMPPPSRRWKLYRGEGDGWTLYFGQFRGARYVGLDLKGFHGWSSSRWLPGGWAFFNPRFSTGRLFMDASRSWSIEVNLPSKLWDFYYWNVKPGGRRYRHLRDEKSIQDEGAPDG